VTEWITVAVLLALAVVALGSTVLFWFLALRVREPGWTLWAVIHGAFLLAIGTAAIIAVVFRSGYAAGAVGVFVLIDVVATRLYPRFVKPS
jgi:hypothetical protein